jgi:hypothetical protein
LQGNNFATSPVGCRGGAGPARKPCFLAD